MSFEILDMLPEQESQLDFGKLEDSPMFRQQIQDLEESADGLRDRAAKFSKACRKYTEGLGEGYDREVAFASALETFGGHNDPICSIRGGPIMTRFAIAFREIGTYKEVLRSQVEHVLSDSLLNFINVDLHEVKEARKRFDKADVIYDQAREKFLSLRKSTRMDIAAVIEEELHDARLTFEQARFGLVNALARVEEKKKFEFLEVVSVMVEAHLRYFKKGYEIIHQLGPYIDQVLAYARKSRESSDHKQATLNERMEEIKRQVDQESYHSLKRSLGSSDGDSMQPLPRSSNKEIETVMQSAAEGKVQTIKQGYLAKRSSNLRGDWKRRFFILDNRGILYYFRKQSSRSSGSGGRRLSSHYHGIMHDDKSVARHTVNLLTSTIKVDDADQSDLRFCFRIISPTKSYTLQAESAHEQMDWIEKITGVIASLLSTHATERQCYASMMANESQGFDSNSSFAGQHTSEDISSRDLLCTSKSSLQLAYSGKSEKQVDALKKVPGNDKCADCGAPDPDWASLNLGVLICIECSGIHRNLGVHISKVRSLTLDVRVWEPSVITFFQALGNVFVNSIWEGLLHARRTFQADEIPIKFVESDKHKKFFSKPNHDAHISVKEKFIHAKYAEKRFVHKGKETQLLPSVAQQLWESVHANDKKTTYRLIVGYGADVNVIHGQASSNSLNLSRSVESHEQAQSFDHCFVSVADPLHASLCNFCSNKDQLLDKSLICCSLLHLACQTADMGMVELLLQHGANVNASDSRGQTPLHYSIIRGKTPITKLLLTRGADPQVLDRDGKTPLQIVMETCDDDELHALFKKPNR